jgi:hypothetical protein
MAAAGGDGAQLDGGGADVRSDRRHWHDRAVVSGLVPGTNTWVRSPTVGAAGLPNPTIVRVDPYEWTGAGARTAGPLLMPC